MELESTDLSDYLQPTPIIDWDRSNIRAKAREITSGIQNDTEKARFLFAWVRDNISHSKDIDADIVTCKASEVLQHGTGICYAKSHLLAAMLRSVGIPAGFCYQVLRNDPPYDAMCLHGLNGIFIASVNQWIRVDPRGNTGDIDAQFSLTEERLAFPMDKARGEFIYDLIFANPAPAIVDVLSRFRSRREMWAHLPASLSG